MGTRRASVTLVVAASTAAPEVASSRTCAGAAPRAGRPRCAGPPDAADAAEVVVEAIPAANGCCRLSGAPRAPASSTPGSASTSVDGRVNAREAHGRLGVEPSSRIAASTVAIAAVSQAGRACGADRELEAVRVEDERRGHPALEVVAELRVAGRNVRLPEEVVQLGVEAGHPNPAPTPERVREHRTRGRASRRRPCSWCARRRSVESRTRLREPAPFRRRSACRCVGSRGSSSGTPTGRRGSRASTVDARRPQARARSGGTTRGRTACEHDAVDLEQRLGDRASIDSSPLSSSRKCLEGLYRGRAVRGARPHEACARPR